MKIHDVAGGALTCHSDCGESPWLFPNVIIYPCTQSRASLPSQLGTRDARRIWGGWVELGVEKGI